MSLLMVSLGGFDVLLVLLITSVAFKGRRTMPDPEDVSALVHALERSRLQFAVVAAAWAIVLAGHMLILIFDVVAEKAELYLLLGQAILLALVLVFEMGLYGAANPADPDEALPERAA